MPIVTFDPAKFMARYPQFADCDPAFLQACFDEAGLYLNNTELSPVTDVGERERLLHMLVAHLVALNAAIEQGNSGVGRVASASEGSVSVSLDYGAVTGSQAWYAQTPYGASYWAATSAYRRFRWVP